MHLSCLQDSYNWVEQTNSTVTDWCLSFSNIHIALWMCHRINLACPTSCGAMAFRPIPWWTLWPHRQSNSHEPQCQVLVNAQLGNLSYRSLLIQNYTYTCGSQPLCFWLLVTFLTKSFYTMPCSLEAFKQCTARLLGWPPLSTFPNPFNLLGKTL